MTGSWTSGLADAVAPHRRARTVPAMVQTAVRDPAQDDGPSSACACVGSPRLAGDLLAGRDVDAHPVRDAIPGRCADRQPGRLAIGVVLDLAVGGLGQAQPLAVVDDDRFTLDQ